MRIGFVVVGVVLLGLIGWGSHSNYQAVDRHVFTWISKVTPELASWAKNLSFTDIAVSSNDMDSYLNLMAEGITYWYVVTAMSIDMADPKTLEQQLASLVETSPNRRIYIDDAQYILMKDGTLAFNYLLDAIRYVQASHNCYFILDVFVNHYVSNLYVDVDFRGIDIDLYQGALDSVTRSLDSYATVLPTFMALSPKSLGLYIWAYPTGGASWDAMPSGYLDSVYDQIIASDVARIIIWNGQTDFYGNDSHLYRACLYNYPDWWDKVRTENMDFIEGN